jgi:hypothetical protein
MEKWESLKLANEQYMDSELKKVLKPLTKDLLKAKPTDILGFIIDWARQRKEEEEAESQGSQSEYSALPSSDEDEEISDSEFEQMKFNRDTQRRSVSAESFNPDPDYVPLVVEKEETVRQMLFEKLNSIFMFSSLEEDEKKKVVDAIKVREVAEGERVIVEGDEGNELFAVGSGKYK